MKDIFWLIQEWLVSCVKWKKKRFCFYGGKDIEIIFFECKTKQRKANIQKDIVAMDAFWISSPRLNEATRTSAPRFLWSDKGAEVIVLIFKYFSEENWMAKKEKKKKNNGQKPGRRLFFFFCQKKRDRHFYQLSIIIFYRGTFLCFHLLPIVEAVVNIFILSFCVLKLSCKGSCYINV